ncbi:MAG: HEAT repeat domain-containing protein [Planctomycetota bacterium]
MNCRPHALVLLAAMVTLTAESVAAQGGKGDKPTDLLSIARSEAQREEAALASRVDQLLNELKSSSDDTLAFIRKKVEELGAIGPAAIDPLLKAMDHKLTSSADVNAGINASRAIAMIEGQRAAAALTRLAREGGRYGRLNAVRSLGLRGDPTVLPVLRDLLKDEDQALVQASIEAIGTLGGKGADKVLAGFITATESQFVAAAITGLAHCGSSAQAGQVVNRLRAELKLTDASDAVIVACMEFFRSFPSPDAVPDLGQALMAGNASLARRFAAIAALEATGQAAPSARKPVLSTLEAATRGGVRAVIRAAALAMSELGDDSGVSAVTADLDVEISQNAKNYNARYQRAEIYLDFKKWQKAGNDFRDGLRLEKDPRDPDRVYLGMARAYAGLGRFADAAKYVSRLPEARIKTLPDEYVVFREMAEDSRYGRVFR